MISKLFSKLFKTESYRIIVLMYHRVVDIMSDPWQLAVTPINFEQQIQILQRKYNVISSPELRYQITNKKIKANSICITFDDAYTDNYLYAKPILEKYRLPATFFIPSAYIGSDNPFWWDELETIFLHSKWLPQTLSLTIHEKTYQYHLRNSELTDDDIIKHQAWKWTDQPPTQRCAFYLSIWQLLQPLPLSKIQQLLAEIKIWASFAIPAPTESLPMSRKQLLEMIKHPLFSLGIHTCSHPALAFHPKEKQVEEIAGCKQFLEALVNKTSDCIAYPYGNYDPTTLSIVKEQDLSMGFTTRSEPVTNASFPHELGRYQVMNLNGTDFEKQLNEWFQ